MAAMASASVRSPIAPAFPARALDDGLGIVERLLQGRTRGGVGQQAKRECRHLTDFELFVRQARQRFDCCTQADASSGQRCSAAHARFRIAEQTNEIMEVVERRFGVRLLVAARKMAGGGALGSRSRR